MSIGSGLHVEASPIHACGYCTTSSHAFVSSSASRSRSPVPSRRRTYRSSLDGAVGDSYQREIGAAALRLQRAGVSVQHLRAVAAEPCSSAWLKADNIADAMQARAAVSERSSSVADHPKKSPDLPHPWIWVTDEDLELVPTAQSEGLMNPRNVLVGVCECANDCPAQCCSLVSNVQEASASAGHNM